MAQCSVFVRPTYFDGDAASVREALALGVPVVASDVGGTKDAVVHGQTALLAPDRDPEALADCVVRILRDGELRQRLSAAARDYAAQRFDLDTMVELTMQAYQQMFVPHASRARVVTPPWSAREGPKDRLVA
jgi:glycosyltransferase involved in cell wall biosynthesis